MFAYALRLKFQENKMVILDRNIHNSVSYIENTCHILKLVSWTTNRIQIDLTLN